MEQITRIGLDTSKRFFQLHGVDAKERPVLKRQLTRAQMVPFFAKLPPTLIASPSARNNGAYHGLRRVFHIAGEESRGSSVFYRARCL